MSETLADSAQRIAAMREAQVERHDPIRFRYLEALARRTAEQQGLARSLLSAKLDQALDEYGQRSDQKENQAERLLPNPAPPTVEAEPVCDTPRNLPQLLAYIRQIARSTAPDERSADQGAGAKAELKSLQYFRQTWSTLSVDLQLNQALAQAPENAGPLNSHHLVLRSLQLMRDTAPDYLKHFLSYADALLWLDQADTARKPPAKTAARIERDKGEKSAKATKREPAKKSASERKPTRSKSGAAGG